MQSDLFPPVSPHSHRPIWILRTLLNERNFLPCQVEEGVNVVVEGDFVGDDLVGEVIVLADSRCNSNRKRTAASISTKSFVKRGGYSLSKNCIAITIEMSIINEIKIRPLIAISPVLFLYSRVHIYDLHMRPFSTIQRLL